jgi:hypothetical protein
MQGIVRCFRMVRPLDILPAATVVGVLGGRTTWTEHCHLCANRLQAIP